VYAAFNYGEDKASTCVFEVQRFWARTLNNQVDGTNNNTSKQQQQQQSCSDDDNDDDDKNNLNVVMPIVNHDNNCDDNNVAGKFSMTKQHETCRRCGKTFETKLNLSNMCSFHADDFGNPGVFKHGVWSCCLKTFENAPGCTTLPHLCEETMISIRAEMNPSVSIENVDINVLNALEISIFPGSAMYELQVQISKNLADVLHKYFNVDNIENFESSLNGTMNVVVNNENIDAQENEKKKKSFFGNLLNWNGTTSKKDLTTKETKKMNALSSENNSNSSSSNHNDVDEVFDVNNIKRNKINKNESNSNSFLQKNVSNKIRKNNNNKNAKANKSTTLNVTQNTTTLTTTNKNKNKKKQEGFYIRYLRIGDINLRRTRRN